MVADTVNVAEPADTWAVLAFAVEIAAVWLKEIVSYTFTFDAAPTWPRVTEVPLMDAAAVVVARMSPLCARVWVEVKVMAGMADMVADTVKVALPADTAPAVAFAEEIAA